MFDVVGYTMRRRQDAVSVHSEQLAALHADG